MNRQNIPNVLIVDDDREVLLSFKVWLSSEGFNPLTATNSAEALEVLKEHTVTVALLDFRLESENGMEVADNLRAVDQNLKIIIITGHPSHETAVASMKAGLFDYLSKGTSNDKILETIRHAARAWETEMREKGLSEPKAPRLTFAVVCRHSLIIERLQTFSKNRPDYRFIKSFSSLTEMKEQTYLPEVDVSLVCASCCIASHDGSFPFFNELYQLLPLVKPVVFNERFSDKQKVDLIRVGVKGFFSVDMDGDTMEKALLAIKAGEFWTSRKLVSMAIPSGPEFLKDYMENSGQSYGLSNREKEILQAMALGLKNREIAEKLFISEVTVKSHVNRIFKKFGVDNRSRAIRFAAENKIL